MTGFFIARKHLTRADSLSPSPRHRWDRGDSLWCQWKSHELLVCKKWDVASKKGAKSEKISSEEPCLIWICCKMMVGSQLDQHLAEKVVREANSSSFTVSYSWKWNLATTGCHDGKKQQTECENFKLWSLELCQSPWVVAWKSQSKLQRLGGHVTFFVSAATTFRDNVERKCGVLQWSRMALTEFFFAEKKAVVLFQNLFLRANLNIGRS